MMVPPSPASPSSSSAPSVAPATATPAPATASPAVVPTATVLHAAPLFPDLAEAVASPLGAPTDGGLGQLIAERQMFALAAAQAQVQAQARAQSVLLARGDRAAAMASYQHAQAEYSRHLYYQQRAQPSAAAAPPPSLIQDPNDYDRYIGSCLSQNVSVASAPPPVAATAFDPHASASSSSSSPTPSSKRGGAAVPDAASAVIDSIGERTLLTRRSLSDRVVCSLVGRRYDEDGHTLCTESETATRPDAPSTAGHSAVRDGDSVAECSVVSRRLEANKTAELFDPTHFNTVVSGMGGLGKTTLAAMVVTREDVLNHFFDGVAWVRLGQSKIMDPSHDPKKMADQYEKYCETLRSICKEFGMNPPDFEAVPIPSPAENDSSRKRRIERLMDDARQDMINLFFGMTGLIVLDDLWHPSDARWFSFANTPASALRVLVTTRVELLRGRSGGHGLCSLEGNVIRLTNLSERDAAKLFVREVRSCAREGAAGGGVSLLLRNERKMVRAAEVVKACWCHPVAVRSAARKLGLASSSEEVRQISKELRSSSSTVDTNVSSTDSSELAEMQSDRCTALFQVLDQTFSSGLRGPIVAQALKVCFATFAIVFTRPDCARPFVPASAIQLLWDSIVLEEERAVINDDPVKSWSAQLLEMMEKFGLVDSVTRKRQSCSGDSSCLPKNVRFLSYRIQHDVLLRYAFHIIHHDEAVGESEIGRRLHASNFILKRDRLSVVKEKIKQYKQGKAKKGRPLTEQLNLVFIQQLNENEKSKACSYSEDKSDGYVFQHLIHHMVAVGGCKMEKQALRVLRDSGFIRGRMLSMGFVNGAKAHASDVKSLLKQVASREGQGRSAQFSPSEVTNIHKAVSKFFSAERACAASVPSSDALLEDIGSACLEIDSLLQRQ